MANLQSRQIAQLHLYQVLHTVRQGQRPLARAQICALTGLSQPAVSTLTRRLIESGALMETGVRPSSGSGRRERELALNPDHAWVVGVKVALHQNTIALADFAGGVRNTIKAPLDAPMDTKALVRALARQIEVCLSDAGGQVRQRLAGVGVALPGFIDSLRGEVYWSAVLGNSRGTRAIPLGQRLTDALGVPVYIENDANMLALAEQWFGEAARLTNVAVVTLEHGLGLGLLLNGELYRGNAGLAAELAHVQVDVEGRMCRCGKRGCLETLVTHDALVRAALDAGVLPKTTPMSFDGVVVALAELVGLARAGDAQAQRIFTQHGRVLGQWLGNIVNLLSPQMVLLDGGCIESADLYEGAVRETMREAMIQPHRDRVRLMVRHRGDATWARGAASLVLQRVDESTEIVDAVTRHGFESEPVERRPDS
jgi:predicted NBD/HSP70 family sugar kinase